MQKFYSSFRISASKRRKASAAAMISALVLVGGCSRDKTAAVPLPQHTVISAPVLPQSALITGVDGELGPEIPWSPFTSDGIAFVALPSSSATPVLLTAKHTLGSASSAEPPSESLAPLPISDTAPLGIRSAAGDVAAFVLSAPFTSADAIPLAPESPSPDSQLWVALPPPPSGEAPAEFPFIKVRVMAARRGHLYYRITSPKDASTLDELAGAPVVNAAGQAVAIHLGTAQDRDGSHFGMGNASSRFLPHLLAALPEASATPGQIAATAEPEPAAGSAKD